jgi:hypothetical protein
MQSVASSCDQEYRTADTVTTSDSSSPHDSAAGSIPALEEAKSKRSVSFNRSVLAFRHLHIDDFLSDAEIENAWYTQEYLAKIKTNTANAIKKIMAAGGNKPPPFPRGLEYRTLDGVQRRRKNRTDAWDAVLIEQDRQLDEGIEDTDLLAHAYIAFASHCSTEARTMGIHDERRMHSPQSAASSKMVDKQHLVEESFGRIKPSRGTTMVLTPCSRAA